MSRDRELTQIIDQVLRSDLQLITAVGPPGAGKTRLALMAAEAVSDAFPDGVWFVDLTAAREPLHVLATTAAALGIVDATGAQLGDALSRVLRGRNALLVLDNFEQVLPAAVIVSDLLRACPLLKILVTSRAPLHLASELSLSRLNGVVS